ncbi:MAG: type II toxin-antitoxin system PrlF family antitoxin [Candidatus Bathyarchaeia archaeon]
MSRILGSSKVTAKFQVTIPEEVRKFLGIKVGDVIAFVKEKNDKIYITTEI